MRGWFVEVGRALLSVAATSPLVDWIFRRTRSPLPPWGISAKAGTDSNSLYFLAEATKAATIALVSSSIATVGSED